MVAPAANSIGVILDPAQQRFFADDSRVQAVCWHRQKGKDFTTAAKAVLSAMETGESWFIVSLTQRQADATFAKCKEWAHRFRDYIGNVREVNHEEREEWDKELEHMFTFKSRELLLPNGGRVVSLPGRDPDALAGLTGNVIFTEFGLFPKGGYDHWRVVFPLATRGFRVIAISTPRGKETKFYELVSQPKLYSVHRCDIYESIADGYVLRDQNGKPTDVETFKALYGDDIGWKREYECEFMGALDALIKWALIEQAAALGKDRPFNFLRVDNNEGWDDSFFGFLRGSKQRGEHGWDVARRGDLSVLWTNQAHGDMRQLRSLVVMSNTTFAMQRKIVKAGMDANHASVGCGDSTGLGMDSNETLEAAYPDRWEGVNFGGKRKSDLGSGLATAFRDNSQTLPGMDEFKFIATDVYAVQRDSTKEGSTGVDGKSTLKLVESQNPLLDESHCDIAYAGALAIRAGHNQHLPTPQIGFSAEVAA
ncbi:hypothetical protein [Algisphaera agarilytica]|uniref:Phage FluMu gp28-like protein n=1 Tax=Algisphaera agarilytica TaxID=1385975 RepID=A0A7X0LKR4_9BACT|nr:hypothetical protein [Algisphaera agarilytica]MBB6429213.1 phage FluMu gp28-like protein [Algisphaera agarilytica]